MTRGVDDTADRWLASEGGVAAMVVNLSTTRVLRREVNGAPGLVMIDRTGLTIVLAFTVHDGFITEIDAVVNPEKLRHLRL
ncbi:hypothetical protein [Streptomyces avermitilis]|uniref:hypothetical protein n=1 Tax=Streptomyces avermitilis TaxID=33903 RepID=UPI0033B8A786